MSSEGPFSRRSDPISMRRSTSAVRGGSPSIGELVDQFSRLNTMVMDRMNQMVLDALQPAVATGSRKRPQRSPKGAPDDCCDSCYRDDCDCRCCIGDADYVIYARLGEVRILPIRIENQRRRERVINLEFSGWSRRGGGKAPIQTQIQPEGEFTLPPCSEREVRLRVDISQGSDNPDVPGRIPDVDECVVLYGDLRVEGCDIRPVRLALALLPYDCDPFVVECGCNCC